MSRILLIATVTLTVLFLAIGVLFAGRIRQRHSEDS